MEIMFLIVCIFVTIVLVILINFLVIKVKNLKDFKYHKQIDILLYIFNHIITPIVLSYLTSKIVLMTY